MFWSGDRAGQNGAAILPEAIQTQPSAGSHQVGPTRPDHFLVLRGVPCGEPKVPRVLHQQAAQMGATRTDNVQLGPRVD
jgi:hypothetical protein